MIRNGKIRFLLLFFCLLLLTGFTEPDGDMRMLYITYSGSYNSVAIYIRARGDDSFQFHGRVRRERTKRISLPGGRYYTIVLKRGRYRSRKRVYLPRYNNRELIFFSPNLTGVTVRLRGRFKWAYLYVNDRSYGKIFRNKPRQIPLSTRLRHVIRVERGDVVRTRRVRLRRRGPGRHRRITVFLYRD